MILSPQALVSANAAPAGAHDGGTPAEQASQQFTANVAQAVRTPQRVTGWFVDLIV